jgi:hypothetical protein
LSLSLTAVQQQEFDALVKIQYQSRGFILRDTVRIRTDVIGATCQFRKMGQVYANQIGYQDTTPIQDPGFTAHTATLLKYAAGTGVDEIQDLTVNFDSKRELAMAVALAVGRRSDQIVIDSMGGNASTTIAAGGTNMSYAKLRNVVQLFEQDAVPLSERFCAMSGNGLRALLADDHIVSRFYTSNDAAVDGTLNYKDILGVNVRIIPNMNETSTFAANGGLPLAAGIRTNYAWHKMAIGMAIGQDMRTEVNYLPRETTWFVNGLFFAGAVVVDNLGLFAINSDETVNP